MRSFILSNILFSVCVVCYSQNLVKNNSFEEVDTCEGFYIQSAYSMATDLIEYIPDWYRVFEESTPDLLSPVCIHKNKQAPENLFGFQEASWGDNYAGIACGSSTCEYMQGRLKHPLVKGKLYELGFYVSCAEGNYWNQYLDGFGALLVDSLVKKRQLGRLYDDPHIWNHATSLNEEEEWLHITGNYKAKGGETYIILA